MSNKILLGSSCVHVSSNGYENHYVCNTSMLIGGQVFKEIGEGSSLDIARQNSIHNLGKFVEKNNIDTIIPN